jgi:hypothetical protein
MTKTNDKQIGWSGETLDAILDRRPVRRIGERMAPVGFDPVALARMLG